MIIWNLNEHSLVLIDLYIAGFTEVGITLHSVPATPYAATCSQPPHQLVHTIKLGERGEEHTYSLCLGEQYLEVTPP